MNTKNLPDIRISEIFGPTIQGEGALIGQPTVFVRTGGCDYRCSWCDTMYAVETEFRASWQPMAAADIFSKIVKLTDGVPLVVSLSGGNPAIQPLGPLIQLGKEQGYRFALETQGSISQNWFSTLDVLTLSPKPPSSGMDTDWDKFDDCLKVAGNAPKIALKIVVFDEADYTYAKEAADRYPDLPLFLQPGNHTPPPAEAEDADIDIEGIYKRFDWLIEKAMKDRWFNATILPQLHVFVWGNKRGV